MDEAIDVYCDQFQLSTGAYGCALNFMITQPTPPAPGTVPEAQRLATIRMSLEHLKAMTFILHRQILQQEGEARVTYEIPRVVLNALQISPEDWEAFWRQH